MVALVLSGCNRAVKTPDPVIADSPPSGAMFWDQDADKSVQVDKDFSIALVETWNHIKTALPEEYRRRYIYGVSASKKGDVVITELSLDRSLYRDYVLKNGGTRPPRPLVYEVMESGYSISKRRLSWFRIGQD